MKHFKSVISVALLLAMTAGIAGCDFMKPKKKAPAVITTPATSATTTEATTVPTESETEPTEPETSETTTEQTSLTTLPTTSETTKKPTPTPVVYRKATVANAYKRSFKKNKKTLTTAYPKITVQGKSTKAINNEIAKKFKSIAKKNTSRVSYSYYIGKKYVSLLITVELEAGKSDFKEYYAYNVSRKTGKKLSRKEMLKLLGVSSSTFNKKAKAGIKKMWKQYEKDTSPEKKKMYDASLATKKLNTGIPYVTSKGKKAYLVRQIEVPGQNSHVDVTGTY